VQFFEPIFTHLAFCDKGIKKKQETNLVFLEEKKKNLIMAG